MRKILEECPTCSGSELIVTELRCARCDTAVRSHYRPTPFARLSAEDLRFVEIFVKNRGNVKEMERELEVSYWTIRNRLDEVIDRLDFETPSEPIAPDRRAILDALEAGTIDVQEAADRLANLPD